MSQCSVVIRGAQDEAQGYLVSYWTMPSIYNLFTAIITDDTAQPIETLTANTFEELCEKVVAYFLKKGKIISVTETPENLIIKNLIVQYFLPIKIELEKQLMDRIRNSLGK